MTQLSVNVNKLATLRNSREKNLPDVTLFSKKILEYGAHGITVHPRPDGRHIRREDVFSIQRLLTDWNARAANPAEFNIEGYPSSEFLQLVKEVRPDQCTLVPDPPEALTSNAGWDLVQHETLLRDVIAAIRQHDSRVSLFVEPRVFTAEQADALLRLKPDRIELYTEAYADHFGQNGRDAVTAEYVRVAEFADRHGIGVNAGHDLNQKNLGFLVEKIPWLAEVSIGHALICEALEQGMATTVRNYLEILR